MRYDWFAWLKSEGDNVGYQINVGKNNEIALPDELCNKMQVTIGDILIFESAVDSSAITMGKHCDQTLSDEDIAVAGNLARIFPYVSE